MIEYRRVTLTCSNPQCRRAHFLHAWCADAATVAEALFNGAEFRTACTCGAPTVLRSGFTVRVASAGMAADFVADVFRLDA